MLARKFWEKSVSKSGFTLIEMLVAVILTSLMIGLASIALRNMLMSWKRLSTPYPVRAVAFYRLQTAVHSFFPYVVKFSDGYGFRKHTFGYFFKGTEDRFSFISLSPLTGKQPVLVSVFRNNHSLILSETILYSKYSDYLDPKVNKTTTETVLFDDILSVSCRYDIDSTYVQRLFYQYPRGIQITMERENGKMYNHYLLIRSNSKEKLKATQRLGQNV